MTGAALVVFIVLVIIRQDLWKWVERASWVIALVLFPAAIYQLVVLQRDQRRLADELTKHPDVRVGLRTQIPGSLPRTDPNLTVSAHWQPNSNMSDVVKVPFSAVNMGTLTAHNVLINLVFPKPVQFVPGPIPAQLRDEPDQNRSRVIFGEQPSVSIGVTVDLAVNLLVPHEFAAGFPVVAEVAIRDRPYVVSLLTVVCVPS
jgi:hypothetical protein